MANFLKSNIETVQVTRKKCIFISKYYDDNEDNLINKYKKTTPLLA
jgi:hypothetical protein